MVPITSLLNEGEEGPVDTVAEASTSAPQNTAQQALTTAERESLVDTKTDVKMTSTSPPQGVEEQPDTHAGRPSQFEDDDADSEGDRTSAPYSEAAPKKKKKKSKSKGKNKVTGFEEYYNDAPLTPEESKEEEELYDPSRTFGERIETCIQRYKARRKFDSERKDIFDKWMAYGGVITGPKAFGGGLDANTIDSKDAEDIATLTATDYVGGDKHRVGQPGSDHVVDFEGIVKAFLSCRVPLHFDFHTLKMNQACVAIIRNFLNYILYHNVCPEYNEQVYAARRICDIADKELFAVREASWSLPGPFNVACSTLFGGYYSHLYSGNQEWAQGLDDVTGGVGMSDRAATKIAMAGLGAYANMDLTQAATEKRLKVLKSERLGFEITEVIYADANTRRYYEEDVRKQLGTRLQALGKIKVKTWINPDQPEEDMSDDGEQSSDHSPSEFELWIEENLLDLCTVGMKIEAEVKELGFGFRYFDSVSAVHPSFYHSIPNDMLMGWTEPVEMRQSEAERIEQANERGLNVGEG